MKIILNASKSYQPDDAPPEVFGERLVYRGVSYDLSVLQEGDLLDLGMPFIQPVRRIGGELVVELAYNYSWATSEDEQPTSWDYYTFTVSNGQCPCPIIRRQFPSHEREDESIISLLLHLKNEGWTDAQLAALTPEQIHTMLYPVQPEEPSSD